MSRVSIDDIAELFGITPEETLEVLRDNLIATDSAGNRLFGYRFGSGDLERVGQALRVACDGTKPVNEIEIADIEKDKQLDLTCR